MPKDLPLNIMYTYVYNYNRSNCADVCTLEDRDFSLCPAEQH